MTEKPDVKLCPIYAPAGDRPLFCISGKMGTGPSLEFSSYPCRAWVPPSYYCAGYASCPDSDGDSCDINTCKKATKTLSTPGYCKIIDGGKNNGS